MHTDEVYARAKSPDGKYLAKLKYYDALTFGYYHVAIQKLGSKEPTASDDDVVEVAAEGLNSLHWKGKRVLVVDYDATKHKDPEEDTLFVKKPRSWRGVKILYNQQVLRAGKKKTSRAYFPKP